MSSLRRPAQVVEESPNGAGRRAWQRALPKPGKVVHVSYRFSSPTPLEPPGLMVSKGILVEANREEYVFPMESVMQTVRLPRTRIRQHEKSYFTTFRNKVFPVLRLADHFAVNRRFVEIAWPEEVPMAIVETNRGRVAVAVDRFPGHVAVIVKPMGSDFANITAFQGATIM